MRILQFLFIAFLFNVTLTAQSPRTSTLIDLPVFPGCEKFKKSKSKVQLQKCFQRRIQEELYNRLNHEAMSTNYSFNKRSIYEITIQFNVSKEGKIENVKLVKGTDNEFFMRVKSAINMMNKNFTLEPAKADNEPFGFAFRLPIVYKFEKPEENENFKY